jgi:ribosomal protein S27E
MVDASSDAFALVGNEHRAAILHALLDAHADPGTPYPTPFAVLRERAGVDVSSQFAYHLDELVGPMVTRTEGGYRLQYAGWKAAAALAAGTYASQPAFGPTGVDGACPHCNATALHASYGDAWLTVTCHGCERVLTRYPFPPGAAAARLEDGGVDALLAAFDDQVRSHFALAVAGVCPECAGRATRSLATADTPDSTDTRGDGHALEAVADCEQCGNHLTLPVGCVLLDAPRVLAWATANDVDLVDRPFWLIPELVDDAHVTRTGDDPLEATLTIPATDDEHVVTDPDDALAVTALDDLDVRVPDGT